MGKNVSKVRGGDTTDNLARERERFVETAPRHLLRSVFKRQTSEGRLKEFLEEAFHVSVILVEVAKAAQASYCKDTFGDPDFPCQLLFESLLPQYGTMLWPTTDPRALKILYVSMHGLTDAAKFITRKLKESSKRELSADTLTQIGRLLQILIKLRQRLHQILTEWMSDIPQPKVFDEQQVDKVTQEFLRIWNIPENKFEEYRDFGLLYTVFLSAKPTQRELECFVRNI